MKITPFSNGFEQQRLARRIALSQFISRRLFNNFQDICENNYPYYSMLLGVLNYERLVCISGLLGLGLVSAHLPRSYSLQCVRSSSAVAVISVGAPFENFTR